MNQFFRFYENLEKSTKQGVIRFYILAYFAKYTERQWCSGNMEPFQGSAGGSIPP